MNSKTVATLDGDAWVLNGSKMWITNAGFADVFVVFAKMIGTDHRWADFAKDCAEAHVNEGCGKVQNLARLLLSEVLEFEALEKALAELRTFDLYVPVAGAKLRDRIAVQLIEKGGYPIEHF